MAEASQKEDSYKICCNPFDALTSDKEPFPPFEAALADEHLKETEIQDTGSVLNWSIDTLAELKPVSFSPFIEPKDAVGSLNTPVWTSNFFEDEKQYKILQTPVSTDQPSRNTAVTNLRTKTMNLTPNSSPSMELQGAITQCRVKLQERQRTKDRLPPLTPKQSLCHPFTPSSRSTALNVAVKRKRPSAGVAQNSDWESPRWSASPVAMICSTPNTLPMSPSPFVNNTLKNTPKLRSKHRLSFGFSPIALSHLEQTQAQINEKEDYRNREDKSSLSSQMNEITCTLHVNSTEESTVYQVEKGSEGFSPECVGNLGQVRSPSSSKALRPSIHTPSAPKKAIGRKRHRRRDGTKPTTINVHTI